MNPKWADSDQAELERLYKRMTALRGMLQAVEQKYGPLANRKMAYLRSITPITMCPKPGTHKQTPKVDTAKLVADALKGLDPELVKQVMAALHGQTK